MKSVFIDFISYVIVWFCAFLYQRYALIPELTFEWQAFLLFLLIGVLGLIYHYAKTHITQIYSSSLKNYLLTLCIAGIALGSFHKQSSINLALILRWAKQKPLSNTLG